MALLGAMFAAWLWTVSSPANFWHSYVGLTLQIGSDRLLGDGMTLQGLRVLMVMVYGPMFAVVAVIAARLRSRALSVSIPNSSQIVWIVVGCAFFQRVF